jgi:hypothetical protein
MQAVSAVDSVSLAIQRTRDFLFRPFRWGTYLKLGLVAIITEGWGTNLRSSANKGARPAGQGPMIFSPFDIPIAKVAAIVACVLLVGLVSLWLFYLVTRLRFAYFHCMVRNVKEIGPGWRLYREPATRFFWMNVVVGLCYVLLLALVALPFISGFWKLFHEMPPGGHPDWGLLLALVLPLIPIIFVMVLLGFLADLILRDWVMPHYALENATAGEAWGWVWRSIADEKKEFLVYVLLRLVLPTVATVALLIVLLIPGLVLAGALGAIFYAIHGSFADATGASQVIGILLQVFFGAVGFFFLLLLSICLGGPISTGVREYALTFYGGRYPALGAALNAPAA